MRFPRLRWPLVVLLASIGLTAVAAIEAHQTVRSQERVEQRALREYASFAAWSYSQRLQDTLNTMLREVLGAVNHGDNLHTGKQVPVAHELAHYLPFDERCGCHRPRWGPSPEAFFAIKIGNRALDAGVNTHPDATEGWEVDRPMPMSMMMPMPPARTYSPAESAWLVDSLTRRIRRLGEVDHGFTLVVGRVDSATRIVSYTLMPTAWGDTMVYGARYSHKSFALLLGGVLDGTGLLPATFTEGRRNRDILAVRVRDRDGNRIFESAPGVTSELGGHVVLPERAGKLTVDAWIRPELAGALIIGGLPRSRLPFLLGLLGLAAALSIVAVTQLRREGELAQLRAGFVSSVSHELRTPLAQIRLYLETLQLGRASTEEQRKWSLGHIERETTRLSYLVENVLRFSTLGGDDPTQRQPTDVAAEVARIAEEFSPLARSRKASVVVEALDAPPVSLRRDALRHIVLNLIDNAVKYGPIGQTVRVRVRPDGDSVVIVVEDQGPGIPARDRDRIWRAFTRGDAARESGGGGSGIGLTIVREVTEAHGGTVSLESMDGGTGNGGARFIVRLPAGAAV